MPFICSDGDSFSLHQPGGQKQSEMGAQLSIPLLLPKAGFEAASAHVKAAALWAQGICDRAGITKGTGGLQKQQQTVFLLVISYVKEKVLIHSVQQKYNGAAEML